MSPHATYPFTGRFILRVTSGVADQIILRQTQPGFSVENLREVACALNLTALCDVLTDYPALLYYQPASSVPFERVLQLEAQAEHSPYPPVHKLASYYILDPRRGMTLADAERLLARLLQLNKRDGVDRVEREPELREAAWAVDPSGDMYAPEQGYLKGGKTGPNQYQGINVHNLAVWGKYDGAGIGFVDLEKGWNLGHDDLLATAVPVFNLNQFTLAEPDEGDHGTAALGVVLGIDHAAVAGVNNVGGIVGVAPRATLKRVVSRVRSATDEWDLPNAILAAYEPGFMVPGDVLLIEVETVTGNPIKGYPVEIVDLWFDAIRLAAGNGMIVIEPAGNGYFNATNDRVGRDLDQLKADWTGAPTWRSLDRASAQFLDSGAIVVSACSSAVAPNGAPAGTHRRMDWATFGSRVDCYAWGEDVYSAGYGWLPAAPASPNDWYTNRWNGTSSASAIIAGAALLVQQMHFATRNYRLSPAQVRALLSDRTLGVTVVDNVGTNEIGVMPDLAAIAGEIGAVPDVFIRDSVDDAGAVPSDRVLQSPDIIVRQNVVPNAAVHFGDTGPWANAVPPIDQILPGQPNQVYVRLRNRSLVDAANVTVILYWSEASPLVAPVHWNPAVKLSGIAVPAGGALKVAGPVAWTPLPGDLPASGHGCFVAVVDHPLDPRPPLMPGTSTWDDFLAYVGRNNNVAWRNFMVLDPNAADSGVAAEALFVIRGAGDEAREFSFEVIQRLPDGARIWWDVPDELAAMLRRTACPDLEDSGETHGGRRLVLRHQRLVRLPPILLAAEPYPCTLHVTLPRAPDPGYGKVVLRQLFGKLEVGRLTWEIRGHDRPR